MALTSHVSNAEISFNPDTGLVLGDVDPAITQAGCVTKFRDADDENASDLDTNKAAFDPHDHGAAGGGQQIGTGGVIAIADDGIDAAALAPSSVTSAKIVDGSVTTAKITDDTVEKAQLGVPKFKTKSGSTSHSFTFGGVSVIPLFHVEADPTAVGLNVAPYNVKVNSSSSIAVTVGSGSIPVTVRAYGCTGIS